MKKLTVIALSLVAAGAAMANGLTREQVIADLQQARADGSLVQMHSETSGAFGRAAIDAKSTVSRAEVLAELSQARASGELARLSRESYEPVIPTGSTKTRAEVRAELQRARANGELVIGTRNLGGYAHLDALNKARATNRQQLLAGQPATAQ